MLNPLHVFKRRQQQWVPKNTPDWDELQDADNWLFFEYGEFKSKFPLHDKIGSPDIEGQAFTAQKIPLWSRNCDKDSFPIAVDHLRDDLVGVNRSRVLGELMKIPTNRIPYLDNYRQNGVNFDRKLTNLILPGGNEIRAFMYKGRKDMWSKWIDWDHQFYRNNGDFSFIHPQRRAKNSNDFYSIFTRLDFKPGANKCFLGISNGAKPPKQAA